MGRLFVYRPPWTRLARRLARWKREFVFGPGVYVGDAAGYLGPSLRAMTEMGPAIEAATFMSSSSRAQTHLGPSVEATAEIRGATDGLVRLGVQ